MNANEYSIRRSRIEPNVFGHILSELTISVDPFYQGKGLGRKLFPNKCKCPFTSNNASSRVGIRKIVGLPNPFFKESFFNESSV